MEKSRLFSLVLIFAYGLLGLWIIISCGTPAIDFSPPTTLSYTIGNASGGEGRVFTLTNGNAGASSAPTTDGVSVDYALKVTNIDSNQTVTGYSIDSSTGIISWTAVATPGTNILAVTVANSGASKTFYLTLRVTPTAITSISYTIMGKEVLAGNSVQILAEIAGATSTPVTDGTGAIYSLSGNPATATNGITIASTGVISWTNILVADGNRVLMVSAKNSMGSKSITITLSPIASVVVPSSLAYTYPSGTSYTTNVGVGGSSLAPTITTGGETVLWGMTVSPTASGVSIGETGIVKRKTKKKK